MNKKFNMTIKQGAAHDSVSVETDAGMTKVDMSHMTKRERSDVTELVVDAFCAHSNYRPLYS